MKIAYYSVAPFVSSGFGVCTRYLAYHLAKKHEVDIYSYFGYEGAEIPFMIEDRQVKIIGGNGTLVHPVFFERYNEYDVQILHFDGWVISRQIAKLQDANIIHWCVEGDTEVITPNGIKKIRDLTIEDRVLGFDFEVGKVVWTKVLAIHIIPTDEDLVVIEFEDGSKLKCTEDHEIYTIDGWKQASDLRVGDRVVGLHIYRPSTKITIDEEEMDRARSGILKEKLYENDCRANSKSIEQVGESSNPQSNKIGFSKEHVGFNYNQRNENRAIYCENGESNSEFRRVAKGLSCGISGWRGDNNYNCGETLQQAKETEILIESSHSICEHAQRNHRDNCQMVGCETLERTTGRDKSEETNIQNSNSWIQSLPNSERVTQVSNHKEKTCRVGVEILGIENETKIQRCIHGRGIENLGRGKEITNCKKVIKIYREKNIEGIVYDITTTTGNYFANKVLIHNCILDHDPVQRSYIPMMRSEGVKLLVPMTNWGKKILEQSRDVPKHKITEPIPHGADPNIYYPEKDPQVDFIPDDIDFFVVAVVDNNGIRENVPEIIEAFALFLRDVEPNAFLYINTEPIKYGGYNLYEIIDAIEDKYNIKVRDKVMFKVTNGYLPSEIMRKLYCKANCLVNTVKGGSFEIVLVESGLCETPAIATDWGATGELLGEEVYEITANVIYKERGLGIKPVAFMWMNRTSSRQAVLNVEDIAFALWYYYSYPERAKKHGRNMRKWVLENATWDIVGEKWLKLLDDIEENGFPEQKDIEVVSNI